jgi:alpha-1,6-mannosyltransferase
MRMRLPTAGLLLLALTLAGLAVHDRHAPDLDAGWRGFVFVAGFAAAGVVYLLAVRLVLRAPPPRGALAWVLGIGIALRLIVLPAPSFLSGDLYRYLWDGRVQQAGINPYRHIPADPALTALRDGVVYPRINRRDYAPTIYPPAAQLIFRAVAAAGGTPFAMKAAMVLFEALAVGCLLGLLALAGLPAARVLIYAWNPLAVWSFAGSGHVDAAAIGLLAPALLLAVRRRPAWAGVALGAAILVKFLPAAIAPALWRRGDWRLPLGCLATIALLYAVYADAGRRVLGFLGGYGQEEGLRDGSGFWPVALLQRMGLPLPHAGVIYPALGAIALAALGLWIALRWPWPDDAAGLARRVGMAAAILGAGVMAVLGPHYPWYYPWLALPAALAPFASVIWLSVAPLLLTLSQDDRVALPATVFLPAILLAALDVRRAGGPRTGPAPVLAERRFR